MRIEIRKFLESDIPDKVRWINDPVNHRYLHYELPLTQKKTEEWLQRVRDDADREDYVFLADGVPCGIAGFLHLDRINGEAEYYITVGEHSQKQKGIGTFVTSRLLTYAFSELGLDRIYLFTETANYPAQKLFEKIGFQRNGRRKNDIFVNGRQAERYIYIISKSIFLDGKG